MPGISGLSGWGARGLLIALKTERRPAAFAP
jgi:hypothetical protein